MEEPDLNEITFDDAAILEEMGMNKIENTITADNCDCTGDCN